MLPVDENGNISLADFKAALRDDTILVSIMMGNNEVGSRMPIHEIGEILKDHQAWFHTDAVQAYGLLPIDVEADHIDLMSTSAHKLNGPKMVGFLYRRDGISFPSFVAVVIRKQSAVREPRMFQPSRRLLRQFPLIPLRKSKSVKNVIITLSS